MTDDKKIELLYDHYKDTFENQKLSLKKRNLYTIICLGLIGTMAFQLADPNQIDSISNELVKNNIGNISIDHRYINNILTFALLWVVMLYYQINILIERVYKYIQSIEGEISTGLTPYEITRESATYLDNYPYLSEVVAKIYSIGIPIALILVAFIKWFGDKRLFLKPYNDAHFWFNTMVLMGIIITSVLYLSYIHFDDFRKKQE